MQVKEVMTRGARCARPTDSLKTAAAAMKDNDVGLLPVCGDQDRLVGTLTDRDITVRATAEGVDPSAIQVADVMTPDVVYCQEDWDVREAARVMQRRQIRWLVVLDRDKRLTGVVSLGDLATEAGGEGLAGRTLEEVSRPDRRG
jgi:CBS domain-containing protein